MKRLFFLLIIFGVAFGMSGCANKNYDHGFDDEIPSYGSDIDPIRIVVLPFYTEDGVDAGDGGPDANHYRRMMRYINNQLQRHGFEVINPFAFEASQDEYNRVMERSRDDSSLASQEMCMKYGTDVAYVTWLDVKLSETDEGLCRAKARVDGEGYDSASHDLGVGLSKSFERTAEDCDDAIAEVQIEVGDLVGRSLTRYAKRRSGSSKDSTYTSTGDKVEGGVVKRRTDRNSRYMIIRLDEVTDYETVEVFGKVIKSARGVEYAKMYSQRILSSNPQGSFVTWRATIDKDVTDGFVLQTNIMKMIDDVFEAGGDIYMKGVPYRYTTAEIDMLKGIRPNQGTSLEVQFILDRARVRDREFAGEDQYLVPGPTQPQAPKKQMTFD